MTREEQEAKAATQTITDVDAVISARLRSSERHAFWITAAAGMLIAGGLTLVAKNMGYEPKPENRSVKALAGSLPFQAPR